MLHGMKLAVCTRQHIPENANKAVIWWGLPCSNLWPLKSEGKLFSEDVPQHWWKVVRLSWGFKLLFFRNSQFFWEQLLLEMKPKWIKIALMMPAKEKLTFLYVVIAHWAMSFQRGKIVICCLCAFNPETTILYTWKGYFWSVIDCLRRWNITLKEHLGSTAWRLLYMRCTPLRHWWAGRTEASTMTACF